MKTVILPGYSPHNLEWADAIAARLPGAEVHHWAHWESGGNMDPRAELTAIQKRIGAGPAHLLAKSVGCRLAAHMVAKVPERIGRVVFCGIPSTGKETQQDFTAALGTLPVDRFLVLQNTNDPYARHAEVAAMLAAIAPDLKVLPRPRDDHHYPYPEDFNQFLKDEQGA